MKAGVIFTGSGPVLILTTFDSFTGTGFAQKMSQKGIKKYFACEVDLELCRRKYKGHIEDIIKDLSESDDLRILDYNGHNVFYQFSFSELGEPQYKEIEG